MFLSFSCSCFWLFVTEQITNIFTFQYILNYCFLVVNSHDITQIVLRRIRVHYEFRTFRLLCTIFRSTKVSGFYTHRPNKIVPSHTQQNEKYTRKIVVTHLCLGAYICIRNMLSFVEIPLFKSICHFAWTVPLDPSISLICWRNNLANTSLR